jgi:hypothetical protein
MIPTQIHEAMEENLSTDTEEKEWNWQAMANTMAITLENIRLYAEVEGRLRETQTLLVRVLHRIYTPSLRFALGHCARRLGAARSLHRAKALLDVGDAAIHLILVSDRDGGSWVSVRRCPSLRVRHSTAYPSVSSVQWCQTPRV